MDSSRDLILFQGWRYIECESISLGDLQSGLYRASISGTMAVCLTNLGGQDGGDMLDDGSGFSEFPFERFFSPTDFDSSSFSRVGSDGEEISNIVAA